MQPIIDTVDDDAPPPPSLAQAYRARAELGFLIEHHPDPDKAALLTHYAALQACLRAEGDAYKAAWRWPGRRTL